MAGASAEQKFKLRHYPVCLRLELVNGWLFGIDENRVRNTETSEKVLAYKRDCYSVLFRHFYGRRRGEFEEAEAPKVRMVAEARQTFGIPAAAQLWRKLRLPIVPAMLHDPRQQDLFDKGKAAA